MRKLKLIAFIILFLLRSAYAQDSVSVKVIARSLPDKVMLRWAVDRPLEWKKANEYGFLIERATISRNGTAVIPIERKMMTSYPLKPKPLEAWEALATQDRNMAVLAQALFGDTFETNAPGSGKLGSVVAVNDELEQRFTFGLLAAEQNYKGALLAGWALEDTSVVPGEKYLYRVSVALPPDTSLKIQDGTVYAGPDMYEELPKPIGLTGVFGDGNVLLSWNFNLLSRLYTNYSVERSSDNKSFMRLNGSPIFNTQQPKNTKEVSLFYTDSISNNQTYYYRVKGKTAFGETGPPSEVLKGNAVKHLGVVPHIFSKIIPDDNTVILQWEFKEEGNGLISGFELRRSNTDKGPYKTVKTGIPPTVRETQYKGLQRVNYFTIVALGKNGVESESFSTLVQPVDSVPPKPPVGLAGVIDTTGVVRLTWNPNTEDDLGGYRVYRAHNPHAEFSQITASEIPNANYTDTIPIKNLNRKIYYKLVAEDQRYNSSGFSEVLELDRPDRIPPSPPVLTKYEVLDKGIRLSWIPSSSTDVALHAIYRKNGSAKEQLWEKVFQSVGTKDTSFLDSGALPRGTYRYTVVAQDSSGLESSPASPLTVIWEGKTMEESDIKFSGTVNRELRFINLSWRVKSEYIVEYRLYKGEDENGLKLYKTLDANAKGYHDTDLEINTDYRYGLQALLKNGVQTEIKKVELKY